MVVDYVANDTAIGHDHTTVGTKDSPTVIVGYVGDNCTIGDCQTASNTPYTSAFITLIANKIAVGNDSVTGVAADSSTEACGDCAIGYSWATVLAVDRTALHVAIENCEAGNNGVGIFTRVKIKPTVSVSRAAVAIDDAVFRAILGADSDSFSKEINVVVPLAGVGAVFNKDGIAMVGGVYGGLDVIEISRAVVVNGDGFSDAGADED